MEFSFIVSLKTFCDPNEIDKVHVMFRCSTFGDLKTFLVKCPLLTSSCWVTVERAECCTGRIFSFTEFEKITVTWDVQVTSDISALQLISRVSEAPCGLITTRINKTLFMFLFSVLVLDSHCSAFVGVSISVDESDASVSVAPCCLLSVPAAVSCFFVFSYKTKTSSMKNGSE